MSTKFSDTQSLFRLSLLATVSSEFPRLTDVSTFIYDFNRLYEISRLVVDPAYSKFHFDTDAPYSPLGAESPIRDEDRAYCYQLALGSLELGAVFAASGGALAALWCLIQIIERVTTMKLSRQKLAAEVKKLELENEALAIKLPHVLQKEYEEFKHSAKIDEIVQSDRAVFKNFDEIQRRLVAVEIKVVSIDIEYLAGKNSQLERKV